MSDQAPKKNPFWIEIEAIGPDGPQTIAVDSRADAARVKQEIIDKLNKGLPKQMQDQAQRISSIREASDGAIVAKFDSPLKALEEAAQRHGLLVPESPDSPGRPESPRPTGEVDPQAVEVDDEGFILAADGEILGHIKDRGSPNILPIGALWGVLAGQPGSPSPVPAPSVPEPFTVNDRGSAEWVLARIADQESKVAAVEIRQRAVNANMDAQKKKAASKAAWLRGRFGAELEAFARGELAASNGKSKKPAKTLVLDNGRVSFRTSPGTAKVTDRFKAIAWLRARGFVDAIKVTEDVIVGKAVAAIEEMEVEAGIIGNGSDWAEEIRGEVASWLERSGPREVCRIVTGVEGGE